MSEQGFAAQGFDAQGLDAQGLDAQGLDAQGLAAQGFFPVQGPVCPSATMIVEPLTEEALTLPGKKPTKLVDNREAVAIVAIYCNFMVFIL